MTRHLLKLGHRCIAYLDYATGSGRETAKYQGHRAALKQPTSPEHEVGMDVEGLGHLLGRAGREELHSPRAR